MSTRYFRLWPGLMLFLLCGLLRVGLADRHGLWADELFSLAMATGHSLEHPAAIADPGHGDFIEAVVALPPSAYSRYVQHDSPPAGPARVVRAVFLSETSPPIYFLLLNGWTRVLGTSDSALRLFSIMWSLACFPIIWSLARQVGGRAASLPACVLFTFSPACLFYSTEGRMYSLVWFLTAGAMLLTLDLHRHGFRWGTFLLWVGAGAAGLLTHYFFIFAWAGSLAWLLLYPGKFGRVWIVSGIILVGLSVLPWYRHLPESLANWRVTNNWLNLEPEGYDSLTAFLFLPWSFLSIRGVWGVPPRYDLINMGIFLVLAATMVGKLKWSLFLERRRLLWIWLLSPCVGVLAFDIWRGTYAMAVPRYVLAGMPAAFLLVGLGIGRLHAWPRWIFLSLIVLLCTIGIRRQFLNQSRSYEPTRQVGQMLVEITSASDLVIVHSIPSGVAGIARYMEAAGASQNGVGFASWVGQLDQRRVPQDLQKLATGRKQIILVKIHEVGAPAPEETWLELSANSKEKKQYEGISWQIFQPCGADTFFPLRSPTTLP